MLIDTHCHLDAAEFDADRDAVFTAARQAGVGAVVVPAVSVDNFAAVRDCCARYPGCLPAYGIHPMFVDRADDADLDRLRDWLTEELAGPLPPVAVGEIGLDRFAPCADPARQERFFVEQLKIARDLGLPVLLHVRRAVDAVLKQLRRITPPGGIAHAFNGSRQQAEVFIGLDFRLGFGGAMTHAGSTRIRQLAATLPLSAIVLETDAPDIPPAWLQGRRNAPSELIGIAEVFSHLRGISMAEVERETTTNALLLLRSERLVRQAPE